MRSTAVAPMTWKGGLGVEVCGQGRLVAIVAVAPGPADAVDGFDGVVVRRRGTVASAGIGVFPTARDAITCALDLPGSSVAVHAGEVVESDGQFVGEAVTTAAALAGAVPPGEVWCTAAARGLADRMPGIAFHQRPPIEPHPFDRPLDVVALVRSSTHADGRTVLAGRSRELGGLENHLRHALAGRGGVTVITGDPGVGKTRLTQELASSAIAHGASVLTGRCNANVRSPYEPFIEMLDDLVTTAVPERALDALGDDAAQLAKMMPRLRVRFPDIPEPLRVTPDDEPRLLAGALTGFLERLARIRPLVLVIDDVQWADDASVFLLGQIAICAKNAPILLAATARDDEVDIKAPCWQLMEELFRRRLADRVALRPLPPHDLAAMLGNLTGQAAPAAFTDAIWSVTDGNPFFVEEVHRHLAEEGRLFDADGRLPDDLALDANDVPQTVRLTLQRRLDRLGGDASAALVAAAVIGREFPVRLLEALREVAPAELATILEQAERAGLIVATGTGSRFSFTHELVRQTLLTGVSTLRRQRLHARVADAIVRMARVPEEHAIEIAHHLHEAGDTADAQQATPHLLIAGERALAAAAYADARRFFDRALDPSFIDATTTARLLLGRGTARHGVGDWQGAVDDWHAALDAFEALGDGEAVADVTLRILRRMTASGRLPDALAVGTRALHALGERPTPGTIRVRALTARAHGLAGDHATANRLVARAVTDAVALDDRRLEGEVLAQKAMLHWAHMEVAAVVDAAGRAVDLLGHDGDRWAASEARWELGCGLLLAGRLGEAREAYADLVPVAAATGNAIAHYASSVLRTVLCFAEGDLDAAASAATETIEFSDRAGLPWGSIGYAHLGWVELWRGRSGAALGHFEQADRRAAPGFFQGGDRGVLARGLTECGDRDRALALVASLHDDGLLPTGGLVAVHGAWAALLSAVEVLAVLREHDGAARLYPLVAEGLATGAVLDLWGGRLLERIAGMAAAEARSWDVAEQHFEAALAQADVLPHRIEQPEVRVAFAAMLVQRNSPGDRQRARALAAEALEQYQALGLGNRAGLAHHIVWAYTAPSTPRSDGAIHALFRQEGDIWSVGYAGRMTRVRDAKGMHHLARLLREPGRELHAVDLAAGPEGLVLGDAGPLLDSTATASYRRRLGDLAEELEEARTFSDFERAAKIENEIDALTAELTRAVGIGGRDRRAASAAERARLNVTRAIRSAIDRIADTHPNLGEHLRVTVRTGTYCSYLPDPATAPDWEF